MAIDSKADTEIVDVISLSEYVATNAEKSPARMSADKAGVATTDRPNIAATPARPLMKFETRITTNFKIGVEVR